MLLIRYAHSMSRFGRDYLNVELYTEMRFPEIGVRFIAVSDDVDSEEALDKLNEFQLKKRHRRRVLQYRVDLSIIILLFKLYDIPFPKDHI